MREREVRAGGVRRILRRGMVGGFVLTLAACLSVDGELTVEPDGSGVLALHYDVANETLFVGEAVADEARMPLPLRRDDFQSSADTDERLQLASYRMRRGSERTSVEAELAFDHPEALAGLITPVEAPPRFDPERRSLTIRLSEGARARDQQDDTQVAELLERALVDEVVRIEVSLPDQVRESTVTGEGVSAERAVFSAPTAAFLLSREPVEWTVTW